MRLLFVAPLYGRLEYARAALGGREFSNVFCIATRENRRLRERSIFAELYRRGYQKRLLVRSRKSVLYVFHRQAV
jgi:hypothetical protein